MSNAAEKKIAELEAALDDVTKELIGTQEMLAFVLKAVGEDVVVPKSLVKEGLPGNTQIKVDDNAKQNAFIFGLVEVDE